MDTHVSDVVTQPCNDSVRPIFFYNQWSQVGDSLSLHFFEPRYRLMIHRIMGCHKQFVYLPNFTNYIGKLWDLGQLVTVTHCKTLRDGCVSIIAKVVSNVLLLCHWVEPACHGLHFCKFRTLDWSPAPLHSVIQLSRLLSEAVDGRYCVQARQGLLHIHSEPTHPNGTSNIVGCLDDGDVVTVFEFSDDGVWARHSGGGWSVRAWRGLQCLIPEAESRKAVLERQTRCEISCVAGRSPYCHIILHGPLEGLEMCVAQLEQLQAGSAQLVIRDLQVPMRLMGMHSFLSAVYDMICSDLVLPGSATGPRGGEDARQAFQRCMSALLPGVTVVTAMDMLVDLPIAQFLLVPEGHQYMMQDMDEKPLEHYLFGQYGGEGWQVPPSAWGEVVLECGTADMEGSVMVIRHHVVTVQEAAARALLTRVSTALNRARVAMLCLGSRQAKGCALARLAPEMLKAVIAFVVYGPESTALHG